MRDDNLWNLGFETIKELETDIGILASGREEIFGCLFGRDSLITSLKLLRVYEHTRDPYFLSLVGKVLRTLANLQGSEVNIESGEEPGKIIHEYRPSNHEHLTQRADMPWYVYPDNVMRNYDSVDSTPLFLIALDRYLSLSRDEATAAALSQDARRALRWIMEFGDTNGDGFLDYRLHPERRHGGLVTQSWMDSGESVFHEDGSSVAFPVAPVEAQSYAFLALRLWAARLYPHDFEFSLALHDRADALKRAFNASFVLQGSDGVALAAGIDGAGKPLSAVRSSMGHCLWASLETEKDGVRESVLDDELVPAIARRLMMPDLFEPRAGIRTLSTRSSRYSPNSYHNGSIWPHDTSMAASGMDIFGYHEEASAIRSAILSALEHFKTPIELFVFSDDYAEYSSPLGQHACKKQAWAAASLLKDVIASRPAPALAAQAA